MPSIVPAAYLVKGSDPILRSRLLDEVVTELLGGIDRSLALEEVTIPGRASGDADDSAPGASEETGRSTAPEGRSAAVAAILNAAGSPAFMTDRRIIVVRDVGALTAADAAPIVEYLDDPLDSSVIVFVAGGGTIPPGLVKKLGEIGAEVRAPESDKTGDVLLSIAHAAGLQLRADAARRIVAHLGEDAGRVVGLVEVLAAAFGPGVQLGLDDIEPYLGGEGAVPAYLLTNAIEAGDVPGALEVLHRLLTVSSPQQPKPMHPLQVMGVLTGYYRRILVLDDPVVRTPADAVAALGGKVKEFPARKALDQARALGTDGIREAFDALYQADLDLKGARAIPGEAVMEVLVARLARLAGGNSGAGPRRGRVSSRRSGPLAS